jgi:hypothetical protein
MMDAHDIDVALTQQSRYPPNDECRHSPTSRSQATSWSALSMSHASATYAVGVSAGAATLEDEEELEGLPFTRACISIDLSLHLSSSPLITAASLGLEKSMTAGFQSNACRWGLAAETLEANKASWANLLAARPELPPPLAPR